MDPAGHLSQAPGNLVEPGLCLDVCKASLCEVPGAAAPSKQLQACNDNISNTNLEAGCFLHDFTYAGWLPHPHILQRGAANKGVQADQKRSLLASASVRTFPRRDARSEQPGPNIHTHDSAPTRDPLPPPARSWGPLATPPAFRAHREPSPRGQPTRSRPVPHSPCSSRAGNRYLIRLPYGADISPPRSAPSLRLRSGRHLPPRRPRLSAAAGSPRPGAGGQAAGGAGVHRTPSGAGTRRRSSGLPPRTQPLPSLPRQSSGSGSGSAAAQCSKMPAPPPLPPPPSPRSAAATPLHISPSSRRRRRGWEVGTPPGAGRGAAPPLGWQSRRRALPRTGKGRSGTAGRGWRGREAAKSGLCGGRRAARGS